MEHPSSLFFSFVLVFRYHFLYQITDVRTFVFAFLREFLYLLPEHLLVKYNLLPIKIRLFSAVCMPSSFIKFSQLFAWSQANVFDLDFFSGSYPGKADHIFVGLRF